MGRPKVGLQLQGVGIELVDQEGKLATQPTPPGKLAGGLADPIQLLGRELVAVVVIIDEPLVGRLGFIQPTGDPVKLGLPPPSRQRLAIGLECGRHLGVGGLIVAAFEREPRPFCMQHGRPGMRFERSEQEGIRTLAIATARLATRQPDDGSNRFLIGQRPIGISRFGVLSGQPKMIGGSNIGIGDVGPSQPGMQRQNQAKAEQEVCRRPPHGDNRNREKIARFLPSSAVGSLTISL